jgi:hypothetical protein
MSAMARGKGTSLLLSIEYIRFMLSNGVGLETLMKGLSGRDLGDVSRAASSAVRMAFSGRGMRESIVEVTRHESDQELRQLLTLLLSESSKDIDAELDEIAQRVVSRKRMSSDSMVSRLEQFLPFLLILMALPLETVLHKVLDDTLAEMAAGIRIPGIVDEAILFSSMAGILFLCLILRYKE